MALGKLRAGAEGYRLRGKLSRKLANPANEAAAAFIEETAILDTTFITQTPDRLRRDRPFTRAEWDGRLVARASRVAEPFICEAVDAVIPARGPARLFEVGCGATAYLRHAAARNPELTALGLELQGDVAALAAETIARWNLTTRVVIEVGDVRERNPEPVFDVATVHQNIYYFPVEKRVEVLRHVRSSLKPGGRLLLTTWCRGRGAGASLLNLWSTMSEGGGRLPTPSEMTRQLAEAGLSGVARWSLIPGRELPRVSWERLPAERSGSRDFSSPVVVLDSGDSVSRAATRATQFQGRPAPLPVGFCWRAGDGPR